MNRKTRKALGTLVLASVFVVQMVGFKVTAFADEATEYSQTGNLYRLDTTDDGKEDYLFTGRNGFFLSEDEHHNDDDPYPAGAGAGTQVTDNSADGNTYEAGHAFDCQWGASSSQAHTRAENLIDPYITGRSTPLASDEYIKLEYFESGSTNYKVTLYKKTGESGSGESGSGESGSGESGAGESGSGESGSEQTPAPAPAPTPEPEPTPSPAPSPAPAPEQQTVVEEPVAPANITLINTSAGNILPTQELGNAEAPTVTVVLDMHQMTPIQYTTAVVNAITSAQLGGAVVIEANDEVCFTRSMMEALTQRSDVSVNVIYVSKGVKYRVIIPAGTDVMLLLDSNGFCGYEYLAYMFGATPIG
ncbi:hypothetical protein bpr_I2018 [Butyrivibrio proteoclasticus B316]|uniref:Cell surface protein n=1 Tax=Butyrivibrio proteoclasticus (strain ATCC 51982 / DSM 14932 / B316) TaxID=515622 RepID=E0RYQ7_BUTPB|nr:hypothetical protein [Butyrivibrio proteoclasticus]ADL34752.1 hypothetical protein bpr_I2018 [Butyrivibrio proteoclasticus B316]